MVKIVYIMGRGHSGSTVLDSLLSNNPNVRGVGEFIMGVDERFPCSCGEYLTDCSFWSKVKNIFESESNKGWFYSAKKLKNVSDIARVPKILLGNFEESEVEEIKNITNSMIKSIYKVCKKSIVVDSSKEVARALFMAKYSKDVQFIHLVRNPFQVMCSEVSSLESKEGYYVYGKTFKSKYIKIPVFVLSIINWLVYNFVCEIVKSHAENHLTIRYEDLSTNYKSTINEIGNFIGEDMSKTINDISDKRSIKIKHKLAGNEMAKKDSFKFRLREHEKYGGSWVLKILVNIITYPLSRKYGYV